MDTDAHLRSGTMVEHKTASIDSYDTIKQRKYRTDTMDTVDTTTTVASHSNQSHSIFNVNTPNSDSNNNTHNNGVIPEHDEINLISQLNKLETNETDKLNNNNELNDDNIDEQLFEYNFRPITFVFISILIIYLPQLIFNNKNNMIKYYLHLIYLIINLIIFFILIPLYSTCIPESIDSIISNANRNTNRQQTQTKYVCQILYSIDALYNRVFNIRNISLSDDSIVNIDSKIHNSIAIVPAGIFVIISNILLLVSYLFDTNNYDSYMRNYATILVFSCVIIVSITLVRQISVHYTQIKDDIRKSLTVQKHIYMQRLELNIQDLTEKNIFKRTCIQILTYVCSLILSVTVWIVYVQMNNLTYDLTVFICVVYTMIFIHLVLGIIFMFNYAIIIIKQFSHPIKAKTMQEIIMYWKLRKYYFDFILYSFMNQMNPILTMFFILITIAFIYIYFMIASIEISDQLPIFIIAVYVLFYLLYGLNMISQAYLLIKKNAKMLNNEVIYWTELNMKIEKKSGNNSEDLLLLIKYIGHNILDYNEYKIATIPINNISQCVITYGFIIFAVVIMSYYFD